MWGTWDLGGPTPRRSLRQQHDPKPLHGAESPDDVVRSELLAGAYALGHGVEAGQLFTTEALPLSEGLAPEGAVEGVVGLVGPPVAQCLSDRDKRLLARPQS